MTLLTYATCLVSADRSVASNGVLMRCVLAISAHRPVLAAICHRCRKRGTQMQWHPLSGSGAMAPRVGALFSTSMEWSPPHRPRCHPRGRRKPRGRGHPRSRGILEAAGTVGVHTTWRSPWFLHDFRNLLLTRSGRRTLSLRMARIVTRGLLTNLIAKMPRGTMDTNRRPHL